MGNTIKRPDENKLVLNERKILKKVWAGIGENPQHHGNVFFLEFCKSYPQYTKYFTLDPEIPLTIDVHITMHFSIIMETMGYLMVDYYENQKQHDYFIGYIAMVHKDMNLIRRDMSNFAVALIEYLTATFPTIMSPNNHEIVSAYVSNICNNISKNIEDLKKIEFMDQINLARRKNSFFVRWISCHDNSVYGKTVDFWTERKLIWEARLEEWKRRTRADNESHKKPSTTEDDITSMQISNDEDGTSQSSQSSNINDSSKTSKQLLALDNVRTNSKKPNVMLKTKKSGQTEYNIVETIDYTQKRRNYTNQKLESSNFEFESSLEADISCSSHGYHEISQESSMRTIKNKDFDSIARKRRRERHSV